jgi:hypothetical protein
VQAPAEEPIKAGAGANDSIATPARQRALARPARRMVVAATALVVAAAVVVWVVTGVLGTSGSAPHDAGNAKLNVAAVLSEGVSRTLQRGLALLDTSASHRQTPPTARHHAPAIQRTPRPRRVFKRMHEIAHSHPIASASSVPPASPVVVRGGQPTSQASSSLSHTYPSRSSAASISPTGESGALGPIQSPNG